MLTLCLGWGSQARSQQDQSQQTDQQGQGQTRDQQQSTQDQPAGQSADLSPDEIIQILQDNPELLAEAKTEIVAQLRDRGYAVNESEVTDDRLFNEISSDPRVQHVLSQALKQRGYGSDQPNAGPSAEQEGTGAGTSGGFNTGGFGQTQRGNGTAPMGSQARPESKTQNQGDLTRGTATNGRPGNGSPQVQGPLRNLPALRDLYTQAVTMQPPPERFGAALFRNSAPLVRRGSAAAPVDIPVGPDYVIGPGDQLVILYWGTTNQRIQATVDREGRILVPEAGAIMVAGRTLADTQTEVRRLLTHQLRGISVDVSLGKLRTVRVYVVGDVKNPGAYDISSLSTTLSALIIAGGPTDTGSYRTVKHFRGKKLVEEVDLYDLMLKGVTGEQQHLESGDSLLVPTVGPQVTVTGSIRRPAIYELRNEQTLDQVLDLAGGVPVTGELNKIKVERIEAHERKEMLSVNLQSGGGSANDDPPSADAAFKHFQVKDGDIVSVGSILPYSNSAVYVMGHVFRPGKFPYHTGMKLTDLIGSFDAILPEPADRAEIIRLSPPDYKPVMIGFNLREVLENKVAAPSLQPFDTIRVFGRYDTDAPKVSIYGEVLRPGEYPLSEGMTAAGLLRMAGGFKRGAYRDTADLSSYSVEHGEKVELDHRQVAIGRAAAGEADTDVLLKAGDVLTIRQIGGWSDIGGAINVTGEVLHPGRYGIQRGERLSSILKRAGGFSSEAYPYGALLDRAQVREASVRSREQLLSQLESPSANGGNARPLFPGASSASRQNQQVANQLKQIEPSGRLLIHISTQVAKWENTDYDIEVRPGDTLFIPKRPNFVTVAGQVYNPAAITYNAGKHADWYLRQAGGPTSLANKKDIFVVRANGTVVGKGSSQWWSGHVGSTTLQPGDTIYVPDKVQGSGIFKNVGQTVNILSGIAVAASVIHTF